MNLKFTNKYFQSKIKLFGKERNVLFNDALNTFYFYGYMASDICQRTIPIVRKETFCCHMGYSFWLAARVLLYAFPTDRIIHTTAFVTPVVEHWLEWEIAQWIDHEGSIQWPITPWANALTTELHLAPKLAHYTTVKTNFIGILGVDLPLFCEEAQWWKCTYSWLLYESGLHWWVTGGDGGGGGGWGYQIKKVSNANTTTVLSASLN